MSKKLFSEHLFEMQKNAFLLDIIQARASAIIQADSQSSSLSETAIVLGVNTAYVDFVLKMRDKNPHVDFESLCQIIYDEIYEKDWKKTARFKEFDRQLTEVWYNTKLREKELHEGHILLDGILSDAKHAYFAVNGRDIVWKEIDQNHQHKQQETEPEIETSNIGYTQKKEHQMELVARLVKDNVITIETAFEYMNNKNDFDDFDNFLRVLDIWLERGDKTDG